MIQKRTFSFLFISLAILLVTLPFVTTFNAMLTRVIDMMGLYRLLQQTLVPVEARMVLGLLGFFGIPSYLAPAGDQASFYLLKHGVYTAVEVQWNCLGWQSLLLLLISFLVGFQGHFSLRSRLEAVVIGILGTFLLNIARMVFIAMGIYYVNTVFAFLIHDYFAALTTIVWLMFFWWFAYRYVLEEKKK